jgi:hypothetical protein
MPDTPGKRQRREVKAKRRQAKDERRTTRQLRKDDPTAGMEGQQLLDENGFPVFDEDGYPVLIPFPDEVEGGEPGTAETEGSAPEGAV